MKTTEKILLALVLLGLTSVSVSQTDKDILEETAVLCASNLGIAAIITDAELSKMVFTRDAGWWRGVLVQLTNEAEADERLTDGMNDLREDYNSGKTEFSEILELSRQCSEAKIQME